MTWNELNAQPLKDLIDWLAVEPWCRGMALCAQDAQYHAEGDVWTHTKLVCQELERLDDWPGLTVHEQTVLLWTALLHDAGKPLTSQTDPETGRISSPKHAVKGEHLARSILRDFGCPLVLREQICRMVRFHGRPAFLFERQDPVQEVVSLSCVGSNRLLYLFALADTRGRDTESMDRPEENLHLFRLAAEEHDCFEHPYPFANDHARFLFFRQHPPNLHYVPHEHYRCTVTMTSGLPGAGKDTWLQQKCPDLPVVSADNVRTELGIKPTDDQGTVAQVVQERCREFLRARQSFAFNATNLIARTRLRWIDLFADYDARVEIVYLEPPAAVIFHQNKERSQAVPERVIQELMEKVEPPNLTEAHQVNLIEPESANGDAL